MPTVDTTLNDAERDRWDTDTVAASDVETPGPERSGEDVGAELGAGATVGRYHIIERLGAGGMGVVYRAHDPQLDREVALKLLRAKPGNEQLLASRMLREAKSVAKIRHPNVVTVYDAGEVDGRVFIAMELMRGTDLGKWFGPRRSWREVVQVMLQAARGLRAAHEVGLIHRDFKPDNVVLEDDGNVKVLDFGLARPAYDGETQTRVAEELAGELAASGADASSAALERLTHTGNLVGTPAYMAPEQYLLESLDARADQFSFCVALFQGVYGHRPFGGRTPGALTMNVIKGNIELPEDPRGAPPQLLAALCKGLATKPDDRFASMDALIAELQKILAHGDRRGAPRWLVLVMVLAIAATGAGITLALGDRDSVEPNPEVVVDVEANVDEPPVAAPIDPALTLTDHALALELAVGQGRNKPLDGPQLWISTDTLRLVSQADAADLDIALSDGRLPDDGTPIPQLSAALARVRPETTAAAYDPLTLYIDRRTPFVTVARAIFSGGRAGFSRFDFAVRSGEDIRVFEVKPPIFGDDTPLRRIVGLELDVQADRVLVGARLWAQHDRGLALAPKRWPLDAGTGSCELSFTLDDPSSPSRGLSSLGALGSELCTLGGVSIPVIIGAADDVSWERVAAVLSAALPSEACTRGIVIEGPLERVDGCAAPLAVSELGPELDGTATEAETETEVPDYRRWCFINSRLKSKKVCRSTQAACIAEAKHWVAKPQQSCKGET